MRMGMMGGIIKKTVLFLVRYEAFVFCALWEDGSVLIDLDSSLVQKCYTHMSSSSQELPVFVLPSRLLLDLRARIGLHSIQRMFEENPISASHS